MKSVKSLLALLYLNTVYLVIIDGMIVLSMRGADYHAGEKAFPCVLIAGAAWTVLFLTAAVINTVQAVRLAARNDAIELRKRMKLLKMGAVPYFLLNFILAGALFLVFFAASHGFGIFLVPLPFFLTWVAAVATSVYGIGFITVLNRSGSYDGGRLTLHIIMQFSLVLDVVSTFILLRKSRDARSQPAS